MGSSEKTIYKRTSAHQFIRVVEDAAKKERYICTDRGRYIYAGLSIEAPEKLALEYAKTTFVSLAFVDRPPKYVLFLGLGSGAMSRYLHKHYPETDIDIVEIDRDIVDIAKRFFHFEEDKKMSISVEDGRTFIKNGATKYDMIFLDAYKGKNIPVHLTTVEFLEEANSKLAKGGVVVSNILSPPENKLYGSMVSTYHKVFPHLYIFKARKSGNFIFVATKSDVFRDKKEISQRAKDIGSATAMDIDLRAISLTYRYSPRSKPNAKLLTDNLT